MLYTIKSTDKDTKIYDRGGRSRADFGESHNSLNAPSLNMGPDDVGRINSGNNQMNPLSSKIPSTIVSPQTTWEPSLPQVSIAMTMIFAIVAVAQSIEESENSSSHRITGKPIRRSNFQIVNFEDYLPEDVTAGA